MAHVPNELLANGANPVRGRGVRPARYGAHASSTDSETEAPPPRPSAAAVKRRSRSQHRSMEDEDDGFIVYTSSDAEDGGEGDGVVLTGHRPVKARRRSSADTGATSPNRSLRERTARRDPALDRLLEARARTSAHRPHTAPEESSGAPSPVMTARAGASSSSSDPDLPADVTSSTDPAMLSLVAQRAQRKRLRRKKKRGEAAAPGMRGDHYGASSRGAQASGYGSHVGGHAASPAAKRRPAATHSHSAGGARGEAPTQQGTLRDWLAPASGPRAADPGTGASPRGRADSDEDDDNCETLWDNDVLPLDVGYAPWSAPPASAGVAGVSVPAQSVPPAVAGPLFTYVVEARLEHTFDVVSVCCPDASVERAWLAAAIAAAYSATFQVKMDNVALFDTSMAAIEDDVRVPVQPTVLNVVFTGTVGATPSAADRWRRAHALGLAGERGDDLTLALELDPTDGKACEEDFSGALEASYDELDAHRHFFAPAEALSSAMLPRSLRVLRYATDMHTLDLSHTFLGASGARQLSRLLWALPVLATLRLVNTGIASQVVVGDGVGVGG